MSGNRMGRWAVLCMLACYGCSIASAEQGAEFFETHIRPVLVKSCLSCHASSAMGGLQMDSREHLLKGGQDGPVIVPGDPDKSLLVQALRHTHESIKMPPQGKLPEKDVENFAAWVKAGAIWPDTAAVTPPPTKGYVITQEQRDFWSFRPVVKPTVPAIRDTAWAKSDIDRFILARLEEKGLKPVRAADKRTLIRRATFDLIGLPPTPEEIDAFVSDGSADAFAKVVDRLLASKHYGERWGRYWLDLARYADGQLGASKDTPYPNAFRYRDWVVDAFNSDMPYDLFAKAQIAGDLLPNGPREKLVPGLGLYAFAADGDDRVDVTGQVFLGLTVGCARCHDHKYDPIPTKDFYSLLGVFKSSEAHEYPLAPEPVVEAYKRQKKAIEDQKNALEDFVNKQGTELGEILARKTSRYMMAAWELMSGEKTDAAAVAREKKLDETTLNRWVAYLKESGRDHKFLAKWDELVASHASRPEMQKVADDFQTFVVSVFADKHAMDDRNYVKLGGAAGFRDEKTKQYTNLESLPIEKYYLWRDLASQPYKGEFVKFGGGVYYYSQKDIDRFLAPEWQEHLTALKARLAQLEKELPPQYPFLHALQDSNKPADIQVYVRGDESNKGEIAPRRFLSILSKGEPAPFKIGSGRMELADLIASPSNPLFARVMANRIWQHHFGHGLVRTPSNFGKLGERPTHPDLLDYLAARFVEGGFSIKAMHREIMLSATYQLSTEQDERNVAQDPANLLLWRANLQQRLDVEALRDSLLAVSGKLDLTVGGPPVDLCDTNSRRTIYATISRTKLDPMLTLFDYPNPNATSEQRMATVGPMQRLYFMNNSFVAIQAKALAERLAKAGEDDAARIRYAYRLLFGRLPTDEETRLGVEFLQGSGKGWPEYAQVLLSSAEFSSVN